MSLRILFADDSVTAQNMGKKILTEAGYEVVAVSNGAAAVKKIAEQKPDIIILDVYMPGYSGLEVCEKVRGSVETMKTPVLLTVGKLEPYKPEDANRVKADGVIVKPFEASDLLAIVKKFEERLVQVPVLVPQPTRAERVKEEAAKPVMEPVEHPIASVTLQSMVEVPDHMATTAAFSDLLGGEPSHAANHFDPVPLPVTAEASGPVAVERSAPLVLETPPPPPPMVVEAPAPVVFEAPIAVAAETPVPAVLGTPAPTVVGAPAPVVVATPVPEVIEAPVSHHLEPPILAAPVRPSISDYELPASWREPQPREAEIAEIPVTAAAEAASVPQVVELEPEPVPPPPPPAAARPLQLPVYQEAEAAEIAYELMPTSAPPLGEIELPREPELQETAAEATRSTVADATDPGLLSAVQQFEPIRASADAITAAEMAPLDEEFSPPAGFQDIPAEIASHLPVPPPPPPPPKLAAEAPRAASAPSAASLSDSDFEARVAAALAAYGHGNQDPSAEMSQKAAAGFPATAPGNNVPPPAMATIPGSTEEQSETETMETPATAEAFLDTREDTREPAEFAPAASPAEEIRADAMESASPAAADLERYLATHVTSPIESATADSNESLQEFEYRPPVGAPAQNTLEEQAVEAKTEQLEDEWASAEISAASESVPSAFEPPMRLSDSRVALAAGIEDALPSVAAEAAVTANADANADHQAIAQAVHRVMERLKPELVDQILRELKSKKE